MGEAAAAGKAAILPDTRARPVSDTGESAGDAVAMR